MQTLRVNHGKSPGRQNSLPIAYAVLHLPQVNSTDAEGSVHVSFEMTDTASGRAAFDKGQPGIFKKIFVVHWLRCPDLSLFQSAYHDLLPA
jgi:hypothetical protein